MRLNQSLPKRGWLASLVVLYLALPVQGQTAMSASDFDAYATGKTLTYSLSDQVWGTEQYLPGRRVIWAFQGETCEYGAWHVEADAICFTYENRPEPHCWQFFVTDHGLSAHFVGDTGGSPLSELAQTTVPMSCPGPDLGV